jgi:hypothetical protein
VESGDEGDYRRGRYWRPYHGADAACSRHGCELFEQADAIRELGVGINTLPHAIRELAGLGLLQSSTTSRSVPTSFIISIATARKSGANPAASMPVMTCRNFRSIAAGCRA